MTSGGSFLDLAQARRSVRAFTSQPVTDEQVTALLTAATAAPSAGNRQPWHFIVVRDPRLRAAFATEASKQAFIADAPVAIVVCADPAQNAERYGERGEMLFVLHDTGAAIQNLLLAAADLGLGACWCGGFDEAAARDILDLPSHLRPVAIIPVGHPAPSGPPIERTERRPLADVVSYR